MSVCVFHRIVCEMGKAEKSQYTGNVQVCVGVGECRPEFMAKSSKYYYFVVSLFSSSGYFCINMCILFKNDDIQNKNMYNVNNT